MKNIFWFYTICENHYEEAHYWCRTCADANRGVDESDLKSDDEKWKLEQKLNEPVFLSLRSKTLDWLLSGCTTCGTDDFGFGILPAGSYSPSSGIFEEEGPYVPIGDSASFWAVSQKMTKLKWRPLFLKDLTCLCLLYL